jgi:hypothetical protein
MVLAGFRPSCIRIPVYSNFGLTSNNIYLDPSAIFPHCYNNSARVAVRLVLL